MARAKSFVLLCFVLVIASSRAAAPCRLSVFYRGCRAVGGSKEFCCSHRTFLPNDQLETKKAVVKEMMMMMEEASLNDKLMGRCKFSVCYRGCRVIGVSKASCASKCHCSIPTFGLKVKITEALAAAEREVDYNQAEAVLEEMTTDELISLNHKLAAKCKYQPCYRACHAVSNTEAYCARKCNCIQVTDVLTEGTDVKNVDDEASTVTE